MNLNEDGTLSGTSTCLWEAMTHVEATDEGYRGKAYGELLRRLGMCACLSWQEIGVTPSNEPGKEGWIINIRGCNEDGKVDILIPADRTKPVEILTDTRATSQPYQMWEPHD